MTFDERMDAVIKKANDAIKDDVVGPDALLFVIVCVAPDNRVAIGANMDAGATEKVLKAGIARIQSLQ